VLPEVIALRVRVGYLRLADAENPTRQLRIGQQRPSKFSPVRTLAARNDVVDRRERQILMIEVTVKHAEALIPASWRKPQNERYR
jgi:hypothetical protein